MARSLSSVSTVAGNRATEVAATKAQSPPAWTHTELRINLRRQVSCPRCRDFSRPRGPLIRLLPLLLLLLTVSVRGADVPRFAKFEASWTLPDAVGNPFDPRVNDVNVAFFGPAKTQVVVPAFWDGDRWRVRYAPTRIGAYTLVILRNGQKAHATGLTANGFRCVPGADAGFVRRDPRVAQRFVFDDGRTYYPLGMDAAWTGSKTGDYPAIFAQMEAARMNWARVWMTFWDGKALDWSPDRAKNPKPGVLLLDAARRLDTMLDAAARDGVYVQLTLQHHGQYTAKTDPNWKDNPFNAANGGFLKNPADFFTDPEARRLTRDKYRYVVARWSYSTHLMGWELFNEVQNIGEASGHFGDVVAWHKEMAACLRGLDVNHHLVTTSVSLPNEPLGQIGLDYLQPHDYPPDIVSTFAALRTAGVPVPLFHGEWGPGGGAKTSEQNLHDGLWASLMAPTAGAGQYWAWDDVIAHAWWPQFASASTFVQAYGLAQGSGCEPIRLGLDAPGPRAALSIAPTMSWGKTTRTDVTMPSDGQTPDLSGVSSFVQGRNHRDLLPQPVAFHLLCVAPCRFQVLVGTVARSGAHPVLALDGKPVGEMDFPAGAKDHDANQTLGIDVPAGTHAVSLFNTGQDWFIMGQISVTGYAPAVAVLAKGDTHGAFFWAYTRDRPGPARAATLSFPGLSPGRYRVRLWDPWQGRVLPGTPAVWANGCLRLTLPAVDRDVAGVVEAER